MAWVESHTVLMRHRKLMGFASELRIRKSYAMGHLHALWHTALEQQEDGDMSGWTDDMIAACADYPGSAPQFVTLLRKHRWMDGDKRIHDWWQYAGPYLRGKYKKSPEKWMAIRDRCVTVTSPDTVPDPNQNQVGIESKQQQQLTALIASFYTVAELEEHTMPKGIGKDGGKRVMDLEASRCEWYLSRIKTDPKTKAALKHRIKVKQEETVRG